jgi:hypothetical protein
MGVGDIRSIGVPRRIDHWPNRGALGQDAGMRHVSLPRSPVAAPFLLVVLILMLLALPLHAQSGSRMDGAAFDAYTRGQTFTYGTGAEPYGAEEYLDNRRVRWSFLDGRCQEGEWYEENGMICFVYDDNPDPQCWSFYQTPRGIVARFEDNPSQTTLYEITRSPEPLMCLGPEVGT